MNISKPLTKSELKTLSNSIHDKINRIKLLNPNNSFENNEINLLKAEVKNAISYLRKMAKIAKIKELGLKII